jgi:hypothetical protein
MEVLGAAGTVDLIRLAIKHGLTEGGSGYTAQSASQD